MNIPRTLPFVLSIFLALSLANAADSPTFELGKGDITHASIQMDSAGLTTLSVVFSVQKRAEFTKFTTDNLGKQVSLVVNGKVTSEPVIREVIKGGAMELPVSSPEEAVNMARSLLKPER